MISVDLVEASGSGPGYRHPRPLREHASRSIVLFALQILTLIRGLSAGVARQSLLRLLPQAGDLGHREPRHLGDGLVADLLVVESNFVAR